MIEPVRKGSRARSLRLATTAGIFVLGAVGAATLTTGALFTDNDQVDDNAFTTGTIDIASTPFGGNQVVVESGNMAPGDTNYGFVQVTNQGSLEYRYSATDLATDAGAADLSTQLKLDVFDVHGRTCDATGVVGADLLGSKGPIATTEEKLFGDSDQGQDTGDRTLAAGQSEQLCVAVHLPLETTNAYQATSSSITLKFYAEQTANNA